MKQSHPIAIGDALASTLKDLGFSDRLKRYEVLNLWPVIVGNRIAEVTQAERFQGGKLFVKVHRAPWRNELTFLKKELIEKINATMQEEIIQEIVFR